MSDTAQPGPIVRQTDPGAAFQADATEVEAAVLRVLRSGRYILGEEVAAFETEFAAWSGSARAVGCGSGTDALVLALRACSIGPGMAVATTSHTAVATVAAIELAGAVPVLIDIDPHFYTLAVDELAALLATPPPGLPPIRAVVPVHLYGQAADMTALIPLCARHDLTVIEDCSQAAGATIGGQHVGTLGHAGALSFYPTKPLAAIGDGGLVLARPAIADRVTRLRQYGWDGDRISHDPGLNSRLDEVQAAILRVRLTKLHAANDRRRAIAAAYDAVLEQSPCRPPKRRAAAAHVFHQYVIRVPDREASRARLLRHGVATAIHYTPAIHQQPAYAGRIALGPARCRETAGAASEVVSLPIYPAMSDAQVATVCAALRHI